MTCISKILTNCFKYEEIRKNSANFSIGIRHAADSVCRRFLSGYSFMELLVAISILVILSATLAATMGPFRHKRELTSDTFRLLTDLRIAQQFARSKKVNSETNESYKFYGLRFYNYDIGDGDFRDGYKIVRYEPIGGVDPVDMVPPGNFDINTFTIIQSSLEADNPEFVERTYFYKNVAIDAASDLGVGDSIVFIEDGAATSDGLNWLTTVQDNIVLSIPNGEFQNITITPLTGFLKIEE